MEINETLLWNVIQLTYKNQLSIEINLFLIYGIFLTTELHTNLTEKVQYLFLYLPYYICSCV